MTDSGCLSLCKIIFDCYIIHVASELITCLSAAIQFIYIYYKNHFVIFLNQCL